ncbi:MAG: hypothetical protein QNJ32_17290 [Xenococcaceae cyanobacterium MO_167.B27]|nr:hypothetical protein [Xenococcaceae cyanobacterium MO_167.B27]
MLSYDQEFEYRVLRQIGFNQDDAKGILLEVYIASEVAKVVKKEASGTLKMFEGQESFKLLLLSKFLPIMSISSIGKSLCLTLRYLRSAVLHKKNVEDYIIQRTVE